MKSLLAAALRIGDRDRVDETGNGFLIECPDGLMIYRDENGDPLPGVQFDDFGTAISGGEFVPCGRQVVYNGACPRCGGRSWIPAAPASTTPMDLRSRIDAQAEKRAALIAAKFD